MCPPKAAHLPQLFNRYSGSKTKAVNVGSYNYLGFGECSGVCSEKAAKSLHGYGIALCSSRHEYGMKSFDSTTRSQPYLGWNLCNVCQFADILSHTCCNVYILCAFQLTFSKHHNLSRSWF